MPKLAQCDAMFLDLIVDNSYRSVALHQLHDREYRGDVFVAPIRRCQGTDNVCHLLQSEQHELAIHQHHTGRGGRGCGQAGSVVPLAPGSPEGAPQAELTRAPHCITMSYRGEKSWANN